MNRILAAMCVGVCAVLILSPVLYAAPFRAEFEVVKITGTCSARTPLSRSFEKAVEGQKYPYGTIIKTGRNSSAFIRFSQYNGCRVFARSILAIAEDARDAKLKTIKLLDEGKVQVKLETEFHKNNSLKVETPSAVCGAVGCNFTVEYAIIGDLKTTTIMCIEGELAVEDKHFSLWEISAGERLTIAKSPDGKFIRIKIVSGDTTILLRKTQDSGNTIELTTGDEVQILLEDDKEDPNRLILIYKIDYVKADRASDIFQCILNIDETPAMGDLAPSQPWEPPILYVVAPEPEQVSPTPVGKRN